MPDLLLGPLLRYLSETEATVWVETDSPCEVEVLGRRQRTFSVSGRHYALVRVEGLEPGRSYEYGVALDGERRWPLPGSELPPSLIRTLAPGRPVDIAFGSCRVAAPHAEPYTLSRDESELGYELDALHVLARQMRRGERDEWPELLFLLGDQVYVDEASPAARRRIEARRDTAPAPGEEVIEYEEYAYLYEEAWSDPLIRWLFSTVSTSMVWDDHDMSDDWNISRSWHDEMETKEWWQRRAVAGIASYWVYQHLGNLSPRELDANELYRELRDGGDLTAPLWRWAEGVGGTAGGSRWSFCRDVGGARAIFLDSRAARVLTPQRRALFDDEVWEWIVDHCRGDFDHLLISTTVPFLLSPGLHDLEAWNERVCEGAWGRAPARVGERLRRRLDCDHWASFQESFHRLRGLLEEVGSGGLGRAPATIAVLSGDVHHAYLAEMGFRPEAGVGSAVVQAVCSPYRNPLDRGQRLAVRAAFSRPFASAARALARLAGAPRPGMGWRTAEGPYFDNQVATIRLDGRAASVRLDKTVAGERDEKALAKSFERRIA